MVEGEAGRAREARPSPPPGRGLRVSAEPEGTLTRVHEWGGLASAASAAGQGRGRGRVRGRRAGERVAAAGAACARPAAWAVGSDCDRQRRRLLWRRRRRLQTRAAAATPRRARCGPWWCCCCWARRPAVSGPSILALRLASCRLRGAPAGVWAALRLAPRRPGEGGRVRDARALLAPPRMWKGPAGNQAPPSFFSFPPLHLPWVTAGLISFPRSPPPDAHRDSKPRTSRRINCREKGRDRRRVGGSC